MPDKLTGLRVGAFFFSAWNRSKLVSGCVGSWFDRHQVTLAVTVLSIATSFWAGGCEEMEPEVVVVNRTGERILIRDISFSGCKWDEVLAYGEASSPQYCMPGSDRVHFKKLDVGAYCKQQAEDGTIDGLCLCDGDAPSGKDPMDSGLIDETPLWFNYQSISIKKAAGPGFYRFEITLDDMEQDFDVAGPYGH